MQAKNRQKQKIRLQKLKISSYFWIYYEFWIGYQIQQSSNFHCP